MLAAAALLLAGVPPSAVAQTNGYGTAAQSNAFGVPTLPDTPPITSPSPVAPPQPITPAPIMQQPSVQQPSMQPPPQAAPPPQPYRPPAATPPSTASRPAMSIQEYLVSLWHGQSADDTGSWDIYVTFNANGTFVQQQTLVTNQFHLALSGRYTVQFGAEGGTIVMSPQTWQPRQICTRPGRCQPVNMPLSVAVPFRLISHDTLATDKGIFQRVGPGH